MEETQEQKRRISFPPSSNCVDSKYRRDSHLSETSQTSSIILKYQNKNSKISINNQCIVIEPLSTPNCKFFPHCCYTCFLLRVISFHHSKSVASVSMNFHSFSLFCLLFSLSPIIFIFIFLSPSPVYTVIICSSCMKYVL